MKQNKVATNLQQDFTTAEKTQARQNIEASKIAYVDALPGHQPISTTGDLFIVDYESGKYFNDGTGNISVAVPIPASGDTGKVLMDTVMGPRWQNQQELPDSIMWDPIDHGSGSGNTHMCDVSNTINNYNYNQILGFVTFTTTSSGSFSIVPCDGSGNYMAKYGSQCWNIPGALGTVNPYTMPFYFRMDGTADIKKIGIKGQSAGSQATIGMVMVEGKINAVDTRPTT